MEITYEGGTEIFEEKGFCEPQPKENVKAMAIKLFRAKHPNAEIVKITLKGEFEK